jgi:hypothetical protein
VRVGSALGHDAASALAIGTSIACLNKSACIVAGSTAPGNGRAGAILWNGHHWQPIVLPKEAQRSGASYGPVSCSPAQGCSVAGVILDGAGLNSDAPLADHLKGSQLEPIGSLSPHVGDWESGSCRSEECVFVRFRSSLNEQDAGVVNGGSKSILDGPPSTHPGELNGINCFAPGHCMVVGRYDAVAGSYPAAYLLAGKHWTTTLKG